MKQDYICKIAELACQCENLRTLDLVYQILYKTTQTA